MRLLFSKLRALFTFQAFICSNLANPVQDELESPPTTPTIAVSASANFLSSEILGVKIINGHKTNVVVDFINSETKPITVVRIAGALSSLNILPKGAPSSTKIISNLTAARYDVAIPAGGSQSLPYSFVTDLHPQDLLMNIVTMVSDEEGVKYQVQAFNETITVVDPATNIFDPQILFLYTLLLALSGLIIFWIYKNWIKSLLPETKRGLKSGEHTRRSNTNNRSAVPEDDTSRKGLDAPSPSGTQATKTYDESWIPEHHLNKPVARRVKNGGVKKKNME
ncbi:hypothetical protein K3495_g570 [Podosphaera aphanis]|nr:hypothetical protein K3495_g570 [Podosphaera aphanis]